MSPRAYIDFSNCSSNWRPLSESHRDEAIAAQANTATSAVSPSHHGHVSRKEPWSNAASWAAINGEANSIITATARIDRAGIAIIPTFSRDGAGAMSLIMPLPPALRPTLVFRVREYPPVECVSVTRH